MLKEEGPPPRTCNVQPLVPGSLYELRLFVMKSQHVCSQSKSFPTTTSRARVLKRSQYFYRTLGKPLVICGNLVCLLCFQKIHSNSINTQSLWLLMHTQDLPTAARQLSLQQGHHHSLPVLMTLTRPSLPATAKVSPREPHPPRPVLPASLGCWAQPGEVGPPCTPTWPRSAVRGHLLHCQGCARPEKKDPPLHLLLVAPAGWDLQSLVPEARVQRRNLGSAAKARFLC